MSAVTQINMIYFGTFSSTDVSEADFNAERAALLAGQSVASDQLQILTVEVRDENFDGVVSDDDHCGTTDSFSYELNGQNVSAISDAAMSWTADVTLSDGTVRTLEVLVVQTGNGDVFVSDLLNQGTLDNLQIAGLKLVSPTGTNFSGWYADQSVDNSSIAPLNVADGIVTGSSGADVIDTDYVGDPDGDLIDAGDAILSGEGADDDIVKAFGGDDVIRSGAGNDDVFAGSGNDNVEGGAGDDVLRGQSGSDTITGGAGADIQLGGRDADTFLVTNADDADGDIIKGGSAGDDNDTLDLTGSGRFRIVNQTTDADGNSTSGTVEFLSGPDSDVTSTLEFSEIENIVPCFTPGTSIATPRGEMLVEDLQVGDKIITRDNGIQEIRWIGAKRIEGRVLQANPHLQPVLIQRGALGHGLPERDMLVSPNHRMLVNNDRVALYFEENEVLVSAKHLVNPTEGVQTINSMGATYIHFMFTNHEVVLSNGAWSESFQPGDYSLKGVGNAQRNEIFELFPELQGSKGREAYASARLTLKKREARMLFM